MLKRGLIFIAIMVIAIYATVGCSPQKESLTKEQKIENAQKTELSTYGSTSKNFSVVKVREKADFVVATIGPTEGHFCGVGLVDQHTELRVVALWDIEKNGMPAIGQEHIKVTNIGYHTLPTSSHNGWESTNIAEPGSISKK